MDNRFEQISLKPGFMKHNGGVLFRSITDTDYEFKSVINENHLNAAGITHGGYLAALIKFSFFIWTASTRADSKDFTDL